MLKQLRSVKILRFDYGQLDNNDQVMLSSLSVPFKLTSLSTARKKMEEKFTDKQLEADAYLTAPIEITPVVSCGKFIKVLTFYMHGPNAAAWVRDNVLGALYKDPHPRLPIILPSSLAIIAQPPPRRATHNSSNNKKQPQREAIEPFIWNGIKYLRKKWPQSKRTIRAIQWSRERIPYTGWNRFKETMEIIK